MLDTIGILNDRIAHWQDRDLDTPYLLNGFRGEFAFSDHSLVPEIVQNLVMYSTKYERFRDVPLELVNEIARDAHGGEAGFVVRALERIRAIKHSRVDRDQKDADVYVPQLSIDDWNRTEGGTPTND